jgi:hypothetical protein
MHTMHIEELDHGAAVAAERRSRSAFHEQNQLAALHQLHTHMRLTGPLQDLRAQKQLQNMHIRAYFVNSLSGCRGQARGERADRHTENVHPWKVTESDSS